MVPFYHEDLPNVFGWVCKDIIEAKVKKITSKTRCYEEMFENTLEFILARWMT